MQVAIAGGGISGLAVAWHLRRLGIDVTLFEAGARVGGKIRSERVSGFLCEWGPAGFSSDDPAIAMVLSGTGLDGRRMAARGARRRGVFAAGRVETVPQSASALLGFRLLSTREKLRAMADLLRPPRPLGDRVSAGETLASFGMRHLGRGGAEKLLYPALPGVYAHDPEKTEAAAAFPWLVELARAQGSILRSAPELLRRADAGLASFPDGMQELPAALAESLGAAVHREAPLRRIVAKPDGFTISVGGADGESAEEARADVVVLAVPAGAAAELAGPVDEIAGRALAAIPYVPVTLAFLDLPAERAGGAPHEAGGEGRDGPDSSGLPAAGSERRLPGEPGTFSGHGYYSPPGAGRLAGAIYASSLFSGRAPEGRQLVTTRFGGACRREDAALPDEELLRRSAEELSEVAGRQVGARLVRAVRHEQALPQYTAGHASRVAAIDAAEARRPGLFVIGNAVRGLGVADCMKQARSTAERVARFVNAER